MDTTFSVYIRYLLSSLVRTNLHPLSIQTHYKNRKQNRIELGLVNEVGEQDELIAHVQ